MQRTFQTTNGGDDGGVHIRKRGCSDAGGEGRSVKLVVGVKNECDVKSAFGGRRGLGAIQHQKKVGGVRQRRVGLYDRLPFSDAIVRGHDHGNLGGQANRLADVGVVVVLSFLGVVERQRGYGGTQNVHRHNVLG